MSYKIAVASTDGKVVNQHFGKADRFYIVEIDDAGKYELAEIRELSPICQGGSHDDNAMHQNIHALADCRYVLVSKIGQKAENDLDSHGISVYVIPDFIEEALHKVMAYVEINNMIEELKKN